MWVEYKARKHSQILIVVNESEACVARMPRFGRGVGGHNSFLGFVGMRGLLLDHRR